MPCVNHPGAETQSWCQNCGKPLCKECVRAAANGQILCEQCFAAGPAPAPTDPAYWQAFVAPPGGPNPSAAAVLGLIPGVGAMYNGQLFKGLIHVIIFAVLVSITDHYGIFGIFIGAWVLYQSFEAYHTAKARREGRAVPDPFGLNEIGNWLNLGAQNRGPLHPGQDMPRQADPGQQPPPPPAAGVPPPNYTSGYVPPPGPQQGGQAPYPADWSTTGYPPPPQPPYSEPYSGQYPGQYQDPYSGYPPGSIPPIPPGAPFGRRRPEPVWAFILIGLGIIFLLHTVGFFGHLIHFAWPIFLIGLGVWLVLRHMGNSQGGSK
jgi:TM2 domain-containing membrane protein YozV